MRVITCDPAYAARWDAYLDSAPGASLYRRVGVARCQSRGVRPHDVRPRGDRRRSPRRRAADRASEDAAVRQHRLLAALRQLRGPDRRHVGRRGGAARGGGRPLTPPADEVPRTAHHTAARRRLPCPHPQGEHDGRSGVRPGDPLDGVQEQPPPGHPEGREGRLRRPSRRPRADRRLLRRAVRELAEPGDAVLPEALFRTAVRRPRQPLLDHRHLCRHAAGRRPDERLLPRDRRGLVARHAGRVPHPLHRLHALLGAPQIRLPAGRPDVPSRPVDERLRRRGIQAEVERPCHAAVPGSTSSSPGRSCRR